MIVLRQAGTMLLASLDDVMARLDSLRDDAGSANDRVGFRRIVGIAGSPGAGKSTLAELVANRLGDERCVVVPMDGFHLSNRVLEGLGRRNRKGAIDTFDADGYLALLERLRANQEPVIYAPTYQRGLEEAIAGSIAVTREIEFVITEGNYLLSTEPPWNRISGLLDASFFVETAPASRLERLIERHQLFGMDRESAEAWANGPDETNARMIEATRDRADYLVTLD
jgi:pantothenate kinase